MGRIFLELFPGILSKFKIIDLTKKVAKTTRGRPEVPQEGFLLFVLGALEVNHHFKMMFLNIG